MKKYSLFYIIIFTFLFLNISNSLYSQESPVQAGAGPECPSQPGSSREGSDSEVS